MLYSQGLSIYAGPTWSDFPSSSTCDERDVRRSFIVCCDYIHCTHSHCFDNAYTNRQSKPFG